MSSHPRLVSYSPVLVVGQDVKGRWLVQDHDGLIEGYFTTRETALGFARAESEIHRSLVEVCATPLTSRLLH